jgi:hypothetical protein
VSHGQHDIQAAVAELRAERDLIDRALQALESVGSTPGNGQPATGRRQGGRTPMSAAQRRAVGLRMKRYWAKRRAEKSKAKARNGTKKAA